jgi:hypothetical protein
MADQGVRFIRRGGRVIPIREKIGAVGTVGTGLGIAAGSGVLAAKITREAAHYENHARTISSAVKAGGERLAKLGFSLKNRNFESVKKSALNLSKANMLVSNRLGTLSSVVHHGGSVLGASVVASGVHKLLPQGVRKHETTSRAISVGAGLGAVAAARSGYVKSMGQLGWRQAVALGTHLTMTSNPVSKVLGRAAKVLRGFRLA